MYLAQGCDEPDSKKVHQKQHALMEVAIIDRVLSRVDARSECHEAVRETHQTYHREGEVDQRGDHRDIGHTAQDEALVEDRRQRAAARNPNDGRMTQPADEGVAHVLFLDERIGKAQRVGPTE